MRHAVELSTGVRYKEFKPIMFKTQVVAGVNYFIKVIELMIILWMSLLYVVCSLVPRLFCPAFSHVVK